MINTLTISKLEEKGFIEFTVLDSDHYYGEVKEGTENTKGRERNEALLPLIYLFPV